MNQLYSYKFRLKPTKQQEVLINKHFGCVRYIYNYFLNKRIQEYKSNKKTLRRNNNQKELPILKKEHEWLKEINSQSLQYSVKCLQNAYDNFFRKIKQKIKGKKGFPRFKKKHLRQFFHIPQSVSIQDKKLIIPKFLEGIEIDQHRKIESKIKFATISKNKVGQYYVSMTVERDIQPLPKNNNQIGLDLNVHGIVDQNNKIEKNPRPGKQYEKRLKLLHQRFSRAKKGSNGRNKARQKLAKLYLKIHNKREDHLHKFSKQIINENQVICVEDLNVQDMLAKTKPDDRKEPRRKEKKRHHDIADCGFYSFVNKLTYKAKWHGRDLIKINRWFPSSQLCNNCNWQNKDLKPYDREWFCLKCFNSNNRDHNAAKNVLREGLRTLGARGIAECPDVRPANSGLLVDSEISNYNSQEMAGTQLVNFQ